MTDWPLSLSEEKTMFGDKNRCSSTEPRASEQPGCGKKVRARVYVKDGNRFIIPGHWYCDDDPDIGMGSAASVICDSMMWGIVCGLKADDWIDLEADEHGNGTIEHYRYDMNGRQFAHGGVTIFLIGGPLFDEEHAEAVRRGRIVATASGAWIPSEQFNWNDRLSEEEMRQSGADERQANCLRCGMLGREGNRCGRADCPSIGPAFGTLEWAKQAMTTLFTAPDHLAIARVQIDVAHGMLRGDDPQIAVAILILEDALPHLRAAREAKS